MPLPVPWSWKINHLNVLRSSLSITPRIFIWSNKTPLRNIWTGSYGKWVCVICLVKASWVNHWLIVQVYNFIKIIFHLFNNINYSLFLIVCLLFSNGSIWMFLLDGIQWFLKNLFTQKLVSWRRWCSMIWLIQCLGGEVLGNRV